MKPLIGITSDMDDEVFRLKQDYVSAVMRAGGMPLVIPPLPPLAKGERGDFSINDIDQIAGFLDGLLLPGGGDLSPEFYGESLSVAPECLKLVRKERVEFELALLGEMVMRKKPVLGICLGMQLINIAFGGNLYQDIKFQVPGAIDHKKGMHAVAINGSFISAFNLQPSTFVVNSYHHQAVKAAGDGLEVFASAEDGIVEGFYKKDYPFLVGVQWHPERDTCVQRPTGSIGGATPLLLNAGSYDKLSLKIFEIFIKKAIGDRQ
ncbi:MAG: gamma-glutamyl-gamma-aminobutyrate hydrolase family protein [Nitrospirae bacterium]|nr:gamma-glutamyl-gamma-aminobutyrate hydrolase family protein [Nitrospirota bacterium]MCL5238236.1 gamma-glutamyl-gamma-aminobutyrate hydrolase family protein [Nitrospirota bacterium]